MRITESELTALMRHDRDLDRDDCLDAETLALLAAGELSDPRRAAALDHVALCSDCAEEARLATIVTAPPAPAAAAATIHRPAFTPAGAFAIAASLLLPLLGVLAWQWNEIRALQQTIDTGLVVTSARPRPAPVPATNTAPDLAPRVAALEAEIRGLSQPQLNPAIIDLESDYLRGGQTSTSVVVPPGAEFFNVILTVARETTYPDYAIEIRDRSGAVIWRGAGARRSDYGTFAVALPRRMFPAGRYELRIVGRRGASEETLQEFPVDIRYQ